MKKTNKKGFTIVELVIVIAVIAILAAVLIPTFTNVVEKANQSAALQEAHNAMTNDLVEANADYANMDDYTLNGAQYYIVKEYVVTNVNTKPTGIGENVKVYTIGANGALTEESTFATVGTKVYEVAKFAGTYADGKYTFVKAPYTCVFDVKNGGWTVTKAD